jgi:hypothetical protein
MIERKQFVIIQRSNLRLKIKGNTMKNYYPPSLPAHPFTKFKYLKPGYANGVNI